jgi:hypothetical protein
MRRALFLALLTTLCVGCATTGVVKSEPEQKAVVWRAFAFGAVALDLATTFTGQRSGAEEQNPALGQQPQRIALVSAAVLAGIWLFSRDMEPRQQATIWKWVAVLHLGAASWNASQLKKVR